MPKSKPVKFRLTVEASSLTLRGISEGTFETVTQMVACMLYAISLPEMEELTETVMTAGGKVHLEVARLEADEIIYQEVNDESVPD